VVDRSVMGAPSSIGCDACTAWRSQCPDAATGGFRRRRSRLGAEVVAVPEAFMRQQDSVRTRM